MIGSKKLAPVVSVVKSVVNESLDGAESRVDAAKLAKESKFDAKAFRKTLKELDKEQKKDQKKQQKREQRLASLASMTGVDALSHPFDSTSRSSSGYEI